MTSIPGVSFRKATSADAPGMAACRLTDPVVGPADARMAAYFDGRHHPQQAVLPRVGYVAESDSAIIGYVAGHRTTRYGYEGEVQYLFVAPAHRRRGVATALLCLLGGWFEEESVRRVCVNVDADSRPAQPFYESLGASPFRSHWWAWEDINDSLP